MISPFAARDLAQGLRRGRPGDLWLLRYSHPEHVGIVARLAPGSACWRFGEGVDPGEALRQVASVGGVGDALPILTLKAPSDGRAEAWWRSANRRRGALHAWPGVVVIEVRADQYAAAAESAPDLFHTLTGSVELGGSASGERPRPPEEILERARAVWRAALDEVDVPYAQQRRVKRAAWGVRRTLHLGGWSWGELSEDRQEVGAPEGLAARPGLVVSVHGAEGGTWVCEDLALHLVDRGLAIPVIVEGRGLAAELAGVDPQVGWEALRGRATGPGAAVMPAAPEPWCWLIVDGLYTGQRPLEEPGAWLAALGCGLTVLGSGGGRPGADAWIAGLGEEQILEILLRRLGDRQGRLCFALIAPAIGDRQMSWTSEPLALLAAAALFEQRGDLPAHRDELALALLEVELREVDLQPADRPLARLLLRHLDINTEELAAESGLEARTLEDLRQRLLSTRHGPLSMGSSLRLRAPAGTALRADRRLDERGVEGLVEDLRRKKTGTPHPEDEAIALALLHSSLDGMRLLEAAAATWTKKPILQMARALQDYHRAWWVPPLGRPAAERATLDRWRQHVAAALLGADALLWAERLPRVALPLEAVFEDYERELLAESIADADPRLPGPRWSRRGEIEIDPFLVTVGQYRAFVEAGGYGDDRWWDAAGRVWLRGDGGRSEPEGWRRQRRRDAWNRPVTGINIHEARACAAWRGARDDTTTRLPTLDELRSLVGAAGWKPRSTTGFRDIPAVGAQGPPAHLPGGPVWDPTGLLLTWVESPEGPIAWGIAWGWRAEDLENLSFPSAEAPIDRCGLRLVRAPA